MTDQQTAPHTQTRAHKICGPPLRRSAHAGKMFPLIVVIPAIAAVLHLARLASPTRRRSDNIGRRSGRIEGDDSCRCQPKTTGRIFEIKVRGGDENQGAR